MVDGVVEEEAEAPSADATVLVVHSEALTRSPAWAGARGLADVELRVTESGELDDVFIGLADGRPTIVMLDAELAVQDTEGGLGVPANPELVGPLRVVQLCARGPDGALVRPGGGVPDTLLAGELRPEATPDELRAALRAAVREARLVAQCERLSLERGRLAREIRELNRIGILLSTERDAEHLLEYILTTTRDITSADAGSLYVVEEAEEGRQLRFKLAQNDSLQLPRLAQFAFPINTKTLAGYVAATGNPLNLPDVYEISGDAPYSFDPSFDQRTGYHTQSMLVLPLRNQAGECIGVVQLINRKIRLGLEHPGGGLKSGPRERIEPFDEQCLELANSLASQAAVSLTNAQLYHGLRRKIGELEQTQAQLVQSEKLASLGQLTAGVAHEINNPLAFSRNNTYIARERVASAVRRIAVEAWLQESDARRVEPVLTRLAGDSRLREDLEELRDDLERTPPGERRELLINFMLYVSESRRVREGSVGELLSSIDSLLGDSLMGLDRVAEIVLGLRNFARLDEATFQTADIDEGIRQTLMILREPARDASVTLTMDLRLERPHPCFPAKLNQVVLNLVNNAIDACGPGGQVVVRSREQEESVEIAVIDDGHGISQQHMSKIFDPFFTTKPVGKGTGLGLSISYRIIREHHGTIQVEPSPGGGTTFRITLPAELETPESEDELAPVRA